jgi:hypothetical protein
LKQRAPLEAAVPEEGSTAACRRCLGDVTHGHEQGNVSLKPKSPLKLESPLEAAVSGAGLILRGLRKATGACRRRQVARQLARDLWAM